MGQMSAVVISGEGSRPAKDQKWKCVRPSAIQGKGQFFSGGGTACDAAFV